MASLTCGCGVGSNDVKCPWHRRNPEPPVSAAPISVFQEWCSAVTEAAASHGNVVAAQGTCPVCGRQDVSLARKERYGTRAPWLVCANEFACFAAWQEARNV